jgi:hypothetical protein
MELLLNLAWLLLAVPAWWLWRGSRNARKFTSLQCVLTLGCVLVMLFPVVSATDDLRAMRAELEEPQSSKRIVRAAANDKASLGHNRLLSSPALLASPLSFALKAERGNLPLGTPLGLLAAATALPPGRAPPVSRLA